MAALLGSIDVNRRNRPTLYISSDNEVRVRAVQHVLTGEPILDGSGSASVYAVDDAEQYSLLATRNLVGTGTGTYRCVFDVGELATTEHQQLELRIDLTSADGELHRRVRCYAQYRGVT